MYPLLGMSGRGPSKPVGPTLRKQCPLRCGPLVFNRLSPDAIIGAQQHLATHPTRAEQGHTGAYEKCGDIDAQSDPQHSTIKCGDPRFAA